MRKALVLVLLVALAAFAAGAWSAAPPSPAEKKLQRDVKTLQADVKKLKARVTDDENVISAVGLFSICSTAVTADGLQGTWQVTDQLTAATKAATPTFGPQVPVSDLISGQSVCQAIGVPRTQTIPPSTASFTALLALFQHSALLRQALR